MINVALLSRWHVHADDYAREVNENEYLSVQLVWDEEEERGRKWAEELGVPFERDFQSVMDNSEIDAVVVTTPTSLHKDIIITAAKHKKHIFTEKILAFTVEECEEIYETVKANQVHLMVSLPRLTTNYYVYAQKAVDEGWLGNLTTIRCRFAHNGAVAAGEGDYGWLPERFFNIAQSGGGALIDLGAHPFYLTNRLAGPVKALQASLRSTRNLGADDNAIVILEYESGSLGVIETSFLSDGSPFQLELYGTEGTLLIEDEQIRLRSSQFAGNGWIKPEDATESLLIPMEQWAAAIQGKSKPSITEEDVIQLTRLNEAAVLSQEENRRIELIELLGE
ncbi:Gfo/Idh/MocA family protein [Oceanobacillus timonensis]|uniref:Gfo/Idh/MocA family protein n=1 Tax=Oceanobacillus timonensis TaxID=1926285 RepID=UPI0009BADD4B|nr:Gfo/Idh/MocA family oxidoreductase [Oceanobacillus timonensis]